MNIKLNIMTDDKKATFRIKSSYYHRVKVQRKVFGIWRSFTKSSKLSSAPITFSSIEEAKLFIKKQVS